MTQKQKELLLKDLCARVPYGIKCSCYDGRLTATLTGVKSDTELYFHEFDQKEDNGIIKIEFCKPYLFPLSSMTEEQEAEYNDLNCCELGTFPNMEAALDYLIENHFDYRGLIEEGLAIDATELNIY